MSTVIQYPDRLFVLKAQEAYQDEDGNWVGGGDPVETFHSMCRLEANDKGLRLETADGTYFIFNFLVQCPKGTTAIPEETEVTVYGDSLKENLLYKGAVRRSLKTQLHTRIWV